MSAELSRAWDERVEKLVAELPGWLRSALEWIRMPSRWWLRVPAAVLFVIGGLLFILPILGLWMLPVGVALLAEDVPGIKPLLEKIARRIAAGWHRLRGGA